ncbi:unnamed protein product [Closterium sp. NIES-64]|nr:unnamed protein product [Closterium sp. NIES-64]CAI5992107.1 unnamed protein product [Closterium sp. NIES-64]
MAASGGLPFNPFNGVNGVNPLSDALRARPPTALSCSLSQGLSLSLLSSLSATWQHGKHRLRASASDASQPLEEPSQKKGQSGSLLERFPLKAAVTASGLALTGDTIAQLVERYRRRQAKEIEIEAASPCCRKRLRGVADKELWQHDFIRALRMASYGFLLYGPGSYVWYQCLDRMLPAPTLTNFVLKVTANQVVLGPCVLLVVFAWNMAWMGKAKDIPSLQHHHCTVPYHPHFPTPYPSFLLSSLPLHPPPLVPMLPGDSESGGAGAVCAAGGVCMEHGMDGQGQRHP